VAAGRRRERRLGLVAARADIPFLGRRRGGHDSAKQQCDGQARGGPPFTRAAVGSL
jgi:hypothetical protein